MTDIVKRLRTDQAWNDAGNDPGGLQGDIWGEAANEIERLRANIERLTNNPADYLYWEGRYRDEAADNERLRAALWQPIETAPRDGTLVLVTDGETVGIRSQCLGRHAGPQRNGQPTTGHGLWWDGPPLTHWMPLPQPPGS